MNVGFHVAPQWLRSFGTASLHHAGGASGVERLPG
jgi:hypothetical protein